LGELKTVETSYLLLAVDKGMKTRRQAKVRRREKRRRLCT
jgi:hypothetical protein